MTCKCLQCKFVYYLRHLLEMARTLNLRHHVMNKDSHTRIYSSV